MGKIACANVLSDLYAMGVVECDNMLMLLGTSSKFTDNERDVVLPLMVKGFRDAANEAGTSVTGGQTVINPWCLIGGVATSVCTQNEFLMPDQAIAGDVLVLTKPLGTQPAVNAYQWMHQNSQHWKTIKHIITTAQVEKSYSQAIIHMSRLNRFGARLMHLYAAHAATDVTGFGILGHAGNLAKTQKNEVTFVIHNLPIIEKMAAVNKASIINFGLLKGTSAETSGGLLVALPREQAVKFCADILRVEGHEAWIIGLVQPGDRTARIIEKPRVIEVAVKPKPPPPPPSTASTSTPLVTSAPPQEPENQPTVARKRPYEAMLYPYPHAPPPPIQTLGNPSPVAPHNIILQQPAMVQSQSNGASQAALNIQTGLPNVGNSYPASHFPNQQ